MYVITRTVFSARGTLPVFKHNCLKAKALYYKPCMKAVFYLRHLRKSALLLPAYTKNNRFQILRKRGLNIYLPCVKNRSTTPHLLRRSEEHTSELQSRPHLVCRLLLEKKNITNE